MEIKVSVIMPSLNVKDYIEEAVRSALCQTLREIEVICIDAGSDDGTWDILASLAKTDGRVVLRHSDVKSYGYQVNLGIDMARGEYLAVLETDDCISPEMYGELYKAAVMQDCDYVKGDYLAYWTQDSGERFFINRKTFFQDNLYHEVIEPKRKPDVAAGDWYLWPGIYKREFLLENNIRLSETPGAAFQDIGFLFQTTVHAKRALYLKEPYYKYCLDREGASSNSGKGLKYSFQEFRRLCEMSDALGGYDFWEGQALYCRMCQSFVCCYAQMEEGRFGITDRERTEYYAWFRKELGSAMKKGIINSENIRPEIWNKLNLLLTSEECYMEKVKSHASNIRKRIGKPGEFPIIIWGCGYYGYGAYKWLKKQRYDIKAFMDNNKALWGKTVNGIAVEPPANVETLTEGTKYLVANERYAEEIRKQLQSMGVLGHDICIYV